VAALSRDRQGPKAEMGMGTGPVGPGVPVAAAVETTAATENNGRRKNAPGVVRLCSAINAIL
jgi:hypothetical protein